MASSTELDAHRRRALVTGVAAFAAPTLLFAQPQVADGRPVNLVVSYPPGGGADLVARLIAGPMGKFLKQAVVVEKPDGVKLSGWYRLGASEPDLELVPTIRRVAAIFGDHVVWGSDWPHTSLASAPKSRFPSLLAPVRDALGEAGLAQVLGSPSLYE